MVKKKVYYQSKELKRKQFLKEETRAIKQIAKETGIKSSKVRKDISKTLDTAQEFHKNYNKVKLTKSEIASVKRK